MVSSEAKLDHRFDIVARLDALGPSVVATEVMTAALRATRRSVPPAAVPVRFALMAVARFIASEKLRLTDTGQLTDPGLHDLAKRLRTESRKDQTTHDWLNKEMLRCADPAQRWWHELNPEPVHKRVATAVARPDAQAEIRRQRQPRRRRHTAIDTLLTGVELIEWH